MLGEKMKPADLPHPLLTKRSEEAMDGAGKVILVN